MKVRMVMLVIQRVSSALIAITTLLAASNPTLAQEKIRLGLIPISEALGAVIAAPEGFFKAEGLDVEITKFESGATAVPVLQSGRLDIALSNTVSTLQAIGQGLDAVVLAPGAGVGRAPPATPKALVAR